MNQDTEEKPYQPYYYNMKPLEEPMDARVKDAVSWLRWHLYEATMLFFAALILGLILGLH